MRYEIWKSIEEKVNSWALYVVKFFSLVLMSFLFIVGLLFSYSTSNMGITGAIKYDPILLHFLGLLGVLVIICVLVKLPEKCLKVLTHVFLVAVFVRYIDVGKELIELGKSGPTADQFIVYRLGELFSISNFGAIQPTSGTYLSFYPHQLGIISVYEIIFRICARIGVEEPVYEVIKNINIYAACGIIFCQSKIVKELFKSTKAELVYLILIFFNVPLILYTSYVYGEILSMFFFSLGLLPLIYYDIEQRKKVRLILSLLFFVISVIFRKNTLILCIAVACVVFVKAIQQKKKEYYLYILILLLGAFSVLPMIRATYEYRAGDTLLDGIPAIAWVTMGMQEDINGTKGVYNGYNYNTFEACNMDDKLMTEVCIQDMKNRFLYFVANPREGVNFYWEKIVHGWTDGTYSCRSSISSAFLQRQDIMEKLSIGKSGKVFEGFCNWYQTLIYFGSLLFLIKERKSIELMKYINCIAVIGGFLFHIMWEMSPRYIMPYNVLVTMNAAVGIVWLAEKVVNFVTVFWIRRNLTR